MVSLHAPCEHGSRIRPLTVKVMYQVIRDDRDGVRATRDAVAAHASLLEDRAGDLPLMYLASAVRNSAAIGDWPAVRRHLPELEVEVGRENPSLQMFIRTFKAQLALQEGRTGEALVTPP